MVERGDIRRAERAVPGGRVNEDAAEREQVRQALPEVEVVDVPDDPAGYVRALDAGLWFETVGLTEEDAARAKLYAVERRRDELLTVIRR